MDDFNFPYRENNADPQYKLFFEKLISQNETIISQNEKLLNLFQKYDKSYNEEIIKDQGRTDLI